MLGPFMLENLGKRNGAVSEFWGWRACGYLNKEQVQLVQEYLLGLQSDLCRGGLNDERDNVVFDAWRGEKRREEGKQHARFEEEPLYTFALLSRQRVPTGLDKLLKDLKCKILQSVRRAPSSSERHYLGVVAFWSF
jgi:hypothetical protein